MRPRIPLLLASAILAAAAFSAERSTARAEANPEELGRIDWRRDFEEARAEARARNLPLLVLFDEIPGCDTVRGYGRTVLSHPLVAEAAETLFVPVVVRNNVRGRERAVLESFGEPTWNNPVVRIVAPDREELAPRLAGEYGLAGLTGRMVTALEKAGGPVPRWLAAFAGEASAARDGLERTRFGMDCFWSGEAGLGAIDGVVATHTGFVGLGEAVEIRFDPRRLARDELERRALASGAAERVLAVDAGRFRPSPKDDKHHLARSPWRAVPMTPMQATRVNAALASGGDPAAGLSPRQIALAERARGVPLESLPALYALADLERAFDEADRVLPAPRAR